MKLLFRHPEKLENLELFLAANVYEQIWVNDGPQIIELFSYYTRLEFQQHEIEVLVHEGQSMSGKDDMPMRLNVRNDTIIKKRNALIHELAHRLLFGNGLYAQDDNDPRDNDEIRVLLFQGDVLRDIYGPEDFAYWANLDPSTHEEKHLEDLRFVLSLTKEQRMETIHDFTAM